MDDLSPCLGGLRAQTPAVHIVKKPAPWAKIADVIATEALNYQSQVELVLELKDLYPRDETIRAAEYCLRNDGFIPPGALAILKDVRRLWNLRNEEGVRRQRRRAAADADELRSQLSTPRNVYRHNLDDYFRL